jgi:hypothetical protein
MNHKDTITGSAEIAAIAEHWHSEHSFTDYRGAKQPGVVNQNIIIKISRAGREGA